MFPWFCSSMNLYSWDIHIIYIHIHGPSHFHGSAVPWIWIYEIYIYIYMDLHVSMVLWFHESRFMEYTYTWTITFPWFCSAMNLASWNIQIYGPSRFHITVVPWIQNHGYMELQNYGTTNLCFYESMCLWFHESRTMETWNSRTMEPQVYVVMNPCFHASTFL